MEPIEENGDVGDQRTPGEIPTDVVPLDGLANPSCPPSSIKPRGRTAIAWCVIAAITLLEVGWMQRPRDGEDDPPKAGLHHLQDRIGDLVAQYLVGAAQMPGVRGEDLLRQLEASQVPGPLGRLRNVVLAGELEGPERAAKELAKIELPDTPTPTEANEAYRVLTDLYAAYLAGDWAAASVSPADREELQRQLGWPGQLALAPKQGPDRQAREAVLETASRVMVLLLVVAGIAMMLFLCGLAGLGLFVLLAMAGKLRWRVLAGWPHGGVYAETFAVWLIVFLLASLAANLVVDEDYRFTALLFLFPATLGALVWPVLRGVPWSQVREDIGWTRGSGVLIEGALGVATYISTWPLLAVALAVTLALMGIAAGAAGPQAPDVPGHPMVDWLVTSGWGARAQLLVLACVMAPLVEETFYRGVLYRHLRELTAPWQLAASVATATLVNALLFAAVHPQGLLGIPLLSTLAIGFSLARQWRGTLIPSMVAHGLTNGVTTSLVLLLL